MQPTKNIDRYQCVVATLKQAQSHIEVAEDQLTAVEFRKPDLSAVCTLLAAVVAPAPSRCL
jgi:hypothetical protein